MLLTLAAPTYFSVCIQVGKTTHHPAVPWDLPAGRAADPGCRLLFLCAYSGGEDDPPSCCPMGPTCWVGC
jgi:hypothetical protein